MELRKSALKTQMTILSSSCRRVASELAGFLFAHLWGMESIDSVNGFGKQLEILLRITGMLLLAFL